MFLVVTIDVEEDNWGAFNLPRYTTKNIEKIPQVQRLFDKYGVRPTYLLSYPVATDERAISIFNDIVHTGRCEIGTHPHPWNTPPLEEERCERNSWICNLPGNLQFRKIRALHDTIQKNFNVHPLSFRSGRWGFSSDVAKNILKLGYKVDTSVTPYQNWGYAYGPNFENCDPEPYRFSYENICRPVPHGPILEIPATIGILQKPSKLTISLNKLTSRKISRLLKVGGIMKILRALNKVWLSPEASDSDSMVQLTETLLQRGQRIFNMTFHSTSLLHGNSPFTKSIDDERRFLRQIEEYTDYTMKKGLKPITLSDSLKIY